MKTKAMVWLLTWFMITQSTLISYHTEAFVETEVACTLAFFFLFEEWELQITYLLTWPPCYCLAGQHLDFWWDFPNEWILATKYRLGIGKSKFYILTYNGVLMQCSNGQPSQCWPNNCYCWIIVQPWEKKWRTYFEIRIKHTLKVLICSWLANIY